MSEDHAAKLWDLLIIGAGPAGLSAAIYAGRGGLSALVLDKLGPGGQVALNHLVENYPGFPDGVEGMKLSEEMGRQAERFGAAMEVSEVTAVEIGDGRFSLTTEQGPRQGRALIIASGCAPRELGVPGERELYQRGVSYCATCDGPLYRGKDLVVIGGGNSAIWESLFLSKIARRVTVVHRRDQLRADHAVQQQAFAQDNIEFLWSHIVTAILGEDSVQGVRVRHVATGEEREMQADGVFVAVGVVPQTAFLPEEIARNDNGFVKVNAADLATSQAGAFAAGDVREGAFRQIACAVGDGALAYRSARHYLEGAH